MEIKEYEELISLIGKKIAEAFLSNEKDISRRSLLLDADVAEITRRIGLEATKIIIEETMAEHIRKKKPWDLRSKETPKWNSTSSSER